MLRTIAYLLVGAIPAAAATWFIVDSDASVDDGNAGLPTRVAPSLAASTESSAPGASNPLAGAYRAVREIADSAQLESELARAMDEPFSLERNARIAALFQRLAEFDLRRALRFADTPGFDPRLVADVFRAWAQSDRDAALAQLTAVSDPTTRIEIAIALLEDFGHTSEDIERVAGGLPEVQRIDFQAEALARRARADANAALNEALRLSDPAARNTAVQRIGMAWTQQDPMRAIARTETLPPVLQTAYRDSVAVEWARIDASGFLAYADSLPSLEPLRAGMAQAMAVDPLSLFEIASRHPPVAIGPPFPPNITVDRTAFTAVVQGDPQWGIAYLDSITDPQRQASYRAAIAETWGRTDPEAALAWARSFDPPQIGLQGTIVWSASMVDMDMAIRWLLDFEETTGQPPPPNVAGNLSILVANDARRTEIANQLRARAEEPAAAQLLTRVSSLWVQTDPEGALNWMLEGGSAVDPALAANVAGRLATGDPQLAASYLERMPAELRSVWLEQVAAPYALQDPDAAADWIARFSSEPNYDTIVQQVVQMSALTDPAGAARMLQIAPDVIQANAAAGVASAWAQRDLASAANWAANLAGSDARSNAVNTVVSSWAVRDPQAAQRWALSLPRGDTRDRALTALVSRFARPDFGVPIDRSVIEAFNSDQARQAAERIAEGAM
jgi:hypothetical protein